MPEQRHPFPLSVPPKVPKFEVYGKRIKKATAINTLNRLYILVKMCAAAVGEFDFQADYDFYAAMVEGRLEDARRTASKRFSDAQKAGAKNLKADKWKAARTAYNAAYVKWVKTAKFDYPRIFVKADKNKAYYSRTKPKVVKAKKGERPF